MPNYDVVVYDQKVKDSFIKVTDEKTYLTEIIFAYQAISESEYLQKCSPESLRSAIVNIALTGVTLNPLLHQAYIVPRKGKACLDISYRGLVKIATDGGGVLDVDATVVHEKDVFQYEQGLNPILKHIPCLDDDPGKPTFVYAKAILPPFPPGITKFIVLSAKEIEKVKKTSAAGSGPWLTWEEEMWRKTAVKKLSKLLPLSDRLALAVSVLNEHEGIEPGRKAKEVMNRFADDDNADQAS